MSVYLGVDVGSASARAGLFDAQGTCHGVGKEPIQVFEPQADFVEQSSDDIWRACGAATRQALAEASAQPEDVRGIGFDATCSLVALDENDRPVTVSPTGDDTHNIVMWMDHRANSDADEINEKNHAVLRYVGGRISPEMQVPKLRWLKKHAPSTWRRTARFLDLPDYLSYRATGNDVRSLCTTVCKWTFLGHEGQGHFDDDFFRAVGLGDLVDERYARVGTVMRPMGERQGMLTPSAASDLGLAPGTPVSVSIIDAHAGGLGLIGAVVDGDSPGENDFDRRIALIAGTSSCHMAVAPTAREVPGVWGPYWSAMVPGLWLTEGGQSATGALLDHVLSSHALGPGLKERAAKDGTSSHVLVQAHIAQLAADPSERAALTRDVHVLPYFHGNRSPRADSSLKGMISGLRLTQGLDTLAIQYLAAMQAIAHGTRHIIDAMNDAGYRIDTILATGGDTKSELFLEEHANATGCRIVLSKEPAAVLLGSAMLAAVASGDQSDVPTAMRAMAQTDRVVTPNSTLSDYHERKHRVFLQMYEDQMRYRELMLD